MHEHVYRMDLFFFYFLKKRSNKQNCHACWLFFSDPHNSGLKTPKKIKKNVYWKLKTKTALFYPISQVFRDLVFLYLDETCKNPLLDHQILHPNLGMFNKLSISLKICTNSLLI